MTNLSLTGWRTKAVGAAVVVALIVGAGAAAGWWFTSVSYDRDIAALKQQHADEKAQWDREKIAITTAAQQATADAIQRMQSAQAAAAALDQKAQEKLTNAQKENDALRSAVAAGDKRVRILSANLATANLAADKHASGGSTSAGGVGDGTSLELTTDAGQRILDIRAGIISDQAKLDYLQGYVRDVVKQCKR